LALNSPGRSHFTPTYSSWINQVERWFALITDREIRHNSFTSLRQLKQQIELFVQRHNADSTPFTRVAIADSILQKIERLAKRISATGH
jgi:putative transposase